MLSEFRSDVEQHTVLPEFDDVVSRARHHRRRLRLRASVSTIAATVVLLPAVVFAGLFLAQGGSRPSVVQISIANGAYDNGSTTTVVTPAPRHQITARLIAAGGVDMAHAYGLLDACDATTCSLQLISLSTHPPLTKQTGLLRTDASQSLANPRLVALDDFDVAFSANVGAGIGPRSETYNAGLIYPEKGTPSQLGTIQPVQPSAFDAIGVVANGDGKVRKIPQPVVTSPELQSTVNGWWVTGNDTQSGELCVSVSHDRGVSWQTTSVGVISDDHTPSLATADGRTVYVLVHSSGQMLLIRSTNGGATWSSPRLENAWNASSRYGVITPPDGSVGVWLATNVDSVSYRRSTNGGVSFASVDGSSAPNGPVVSLPGGYVTLGAKPALSADAHTWTTIVLPVVSPD